MPRLILILVLALGLLTSGCIAREFEATPISLADQVGPGDAYAGIPISRG